MARTMRLQAAVDYLTTYGWAIIVIAIALALTYFYLRGQLLSVPPRCSLATEARCVDMVIGSNTVSSTMQIILVNGQQYAVENTMVTVNMSGVGTYNSLCNPYYVLPGGKILCSIYNLPSLGINGGTSGYLLFNESVCTTLGTTSCNQHFRESYNGTYTATVSSSIPTVSCTMVVSSSPSSATSGTAVTVDANVLFSGIAVPGATVGFTSSSSYATVSQAYALTNPNGTATISLADSHAETVTITGNYISGCTADTLITFS